jgi:hypothetical protein
MLCICIFKKKRMKKKEKIFKKKKKKGWMEKKQRNTFHCMCHHGLKCKRKESVDHRFTFCKHSYGKVTNRSLSIQLYITIVYLL